MLEIKLLTDCWGSESYFGYKNGKQYTEDYYSIAELIEDYPEFRDAVIKINNGVWTLILKDRIELVDAEVITLLKAHTEPIYFNDTDSRYFMFDFKINNAWFKAVRIDMVNNIIEFTIFE